MQKRSAVFLDRDGTIVRHVDLLHKVSEMRLLPGVARAIAVLNRAGFLAIVVTNQPVVARGIASEADVERVNEALVSRLAARGARIDGVYYCPHHPDKGFPGERADLKFDCDCRKPKPGLILRAAREHRIDLKKSFMVGDSTRDTLAGNNAGLTTILVETGHGGKDPWQFKGTPDFVAQNLFAAARWIAARK